MRLTSRLVSGFVLLSALATISVSGQTADAVPSARERMRRLAAESGLSPDTFGTFCCEVLQIPAAAFVPRASNIGWAYRGNGYMAATSNPNADEDVFWAPVQLPSGAKIRFMDLYYDDDDAANDITAFLRRYVGSTDATVDLFTLATATSSGSPSKAVAIDSLGLAGFDVTDNDDSQLAVVISVPAATIALGFKSVSIWWQRQISPAPVAATFGDVPTNHTYFRAIEALNDSGITQGCGGGNFCPQQNVTRGEMAAFLARALGLHFYYPPF